MLRYALKRLISGLIIVWGVLTLTFVVLHLGPGDPTSLYIRPEINPDVVANLRAQMGLDQPIWQQYLKWMTQFLRGNFGFSFVHQRPVNEILFEAVLNTLQLTVVVFLLQLCAGVVVGTAYALKQNSRADSFIGSALLLIYSIPGFWLALMGVMIFSYKLGWLPSSHMVSLDTPEGFGPMFVDRLKHMVLPVLVLATPFAAMTATYVRNSLTEVLAQPYIRTARAYGIKPGKVLFKYAMKNALLPLITLLGLHVPFLISGAVVTEYIFAWPGMGSLTVNAIFAHDYPVILASSFLAALAVVVGNQLADFLYTLADPRISIKGSV